MTEEIKNEENREMCICKSKCFREVLKIALGSFIGVYLALSLFASMHKPPMPCHMMHHHHHHMMMHDTMGHQKGNFGKMDKFSPEHFKKDFVKQNQGEIKE